MENSERIVIDLFSHDAFYPWANIIYKNGVTNIGMYEDGKIARNLFSMDRTQLKQLVNTLKMLIKD